jgi:RNA-binding protein
MLSNSQIKFLRTLAHHRNPMLWIGASGVTESVITELDITLNTHELVKVKILNDDREQRKLIIDAIINASGANKIQTIGKMAILYRPNLQTPKIALPKR